MALNDYETSVESGQPVELYLIRYGASSVYAHTDGEATVNYDDGVTGPIDYTKLAIKRVDPVRASQEAMQDEIKVQIPITHEIADLFRVYPPTQPVTITIRQGHIPNPDDPAGWSAGDNYPVVWKGKVLGVVRSGAFAELQCVASVASIKRVGLRKNYQISCPYAVYQGRCGAVKATYATPATVASVTGNTVVLDPLWVLAGRVESDYLKGTMEWAGASGTQVRTILRVTGGDTITLSGPALELAATDSVTLYVGCTKKTDFCLNVHNTIVTFGGFPGIPNLNPVGRNNHT